MTEREKTTLKRIRTGSFERRLSLTRTGLLAGTRYMAQSASSLLLPRARRAEHRRAALGAQARYLVEELVVAVLHFSIFHHHVQSRHE